MEKVKPRVCLNRPTYVGFQILEQSKLHMCKFWYDVLKERCRKTRLLMTDTDSFILQVYCEDIDTDLRKMGDCFNFSNYDKKSSLYASINRKVPGYMKNEYPPDALTHFAGIRSKEYALKFLDGEEDKRAKRITGVNQKQNLNFILLTMKTVRLTV